MTNEFGKKKKVEICRQYSEKKTNFSVDIFVHSFVVRRPIYTDFFFVIEEWERKKYFHRIQCNQQQLFCRPHIKK